MIIDFHTHIFPDKIAPSTIAALEQESGLTAASNGMLTGLLSSMEKVGVDTSVIVPVVTSLKQFEGVNRFAAEVNERYSPKLISFGGIHPDSEDYREQLKTLKSMGFQGIKLHPDYQGVMFNDIRYKRIVSFASELDMVILVHAGIDIGIPEPIHCTPDMSVEVLEETQASKLVLAHLGGWKLWDEVEEKLVGRNVYLDTAFIQQYISEEQFLRIVQKHGAERILFATDSPWADQKKYVDWIQLSTLSQEDKNKIFSGNALQLLQI
jgi:predicted TIM-barrel fold metal-dependent hydrolase